MTLRHTPHTHRRPGQQGLVGLVPAPPAGRDVLGTVLGVIWALGSLTCLGGLGYLMQDAGPAAANEPATTAPDLQVIS